MVKSALKSSESVHEAILFLVGEDGLLPLQPGKIFQQRKQKGVTWNCVNWLGLPVGNSTWVKEYDLKKNFPEFLVDKENLKQGVIV